MVSVPEWLVKAHLPTFKNVPETQRYLMAGFVIIFLGLNTQTIFERSYFFYYYFSDIFWLFSFTGFQRV